MLRNSSTPERQRSSYRLRRSRSGLMLDVMHLRITVLAKPSFPWFSRRVLRSPVGRFNGVEQARTTAFATARQLATAHSFEIRSEKGHFVIERWVRDGDEWSRDHANRT